MTYFLISLTNACNKECGYCVVKKWRNNPEYPDKITAADVMAFLEKEMRPGDTVELTGGEPTLFPDLLPLLEWLKEHGAKAIMRTNGHRLDSWRKEFPNMVVVLARHDSGDEYMERRKASLLPWDIVQDELDIVPSDSVKPKFRMDETNTLPGHGYSKSLFVTADGNIRFMPCVEESMGNIAGLDYSLHEWECMNGSSCSYYLKAWNLIARIGQWKR